MKRLLTFLFALVGLMTTASAQNKYDLNNDGEVNLADVTLLVNVILGRHEYVDLGLTSGTLWATTNIGADNPEEYGDYFAWGETEPKSDYSWATYKWCEGLKDTLKKYCQDSTRGYNGFTDDLTELTDEDDAAYVHWGPQWRMPSKAQQDELREECTWTWTQQNGVNGYKVVGTNGKSIFLPATGFFNGTSNSSTGSNGYYWSRSVYTDNQHGAYDVGIDSGNVSWYGFNRFHGFSIRPVRVQ